MMAFDMAFTLTLNTAQLVFYVVGIFAFIKYLRKK